MKVSITNIILAVTLTAACGVGTQKGTSKAEARGLALSEWDDDYCAVEGWYDDGVCDNFCPAPDEDCTDSEEACACDAAPAIARICDDGSVGTYFCGIDENGQCDSGFDCPPPPDCDCGPMPLSAWMCDDGSTGSYECVHYGDGTCGVESSCGGETDPGEPTDPPSDPTDPPSHPDDPDCGGGSTPGGPGNGELCDDCGVYPAIAMMCDDGSTADTVCRYQPDGECAIQFECE